jgi:hypothetical protein
VVTLGIAVALLAKATCSAHSFRIPARSWAERVLGWWRKVGRAILGESVNATLTISSLIFDNVLVN